MRKKTVKDVDVKGKRVLVREDFNVPQDKNGEITDDTRIREALPTIRYLLENRAKVILCSHLGRPDGKVVESMRMSPVAARLGKLLGMPVKMSRDCVGPDVEKAASELKEGEVLLLENLRFHPEEEENDPKFARELASLADIYVADAFGTAHRAHASTVGVARYLPAVAGFLMQKEIEALSKALESPERPFAAVVGGAKVKDKTALLENIVGKVDVLLIGGGMVAAFLSIKNDKRARKEDETSGSVRRIMEQTRRRGIKLMLPVDVVAAKDANSPDTAKEVPADQVPDGWIIADIGPKTVQLYASELKNCKTMVWNGPMGIFEVPRFSAGTRGIAEAVARLKATTIIGGGSTAEAVEDFGLADKMTHVSTGGGASLMFLEGKELPGVAVLQDK
ncbi:MAG: phosphoglycerate kinase [Chloroflexi bacterium]|nr:phosphoglycerate kinase [Chloroflexota bacterium]